MKFNNVFFNKLFKLNKENLIIKILNDSINIWSLREFHIVFKLSILHNSSRVFTYMTEHLISSKREYVRNIFNNVYLKAFDETFADFFDILDIGCNYELFKEELSYNHNLPEYYDDNYELESSIWISNDFCKISMIKYMLDESIKSWIVQPTYYSDYYMYLLSNSIINNNISMVKCLLSKEVLSICVKYIYHNGKIPKSYITLNTYKYLISSKMFNKNLNVFDVTSSHYFLNNIDKIDFVKDNNHIFNFDKTDVLNSYVKTISRNSTKKDTVKIILNMFEDEYDFKNIKIIDTLIDDYERQIENYIQSIVRSGKSILLHNIEKTCDSKYKEYIESRKKEVMNKYYDKSKIFCSFNNVY